MADLQPDSGQFVTLTKVPSTELAPAAAPKLPARVGWGVEVHHGRRDDRDSYSVTAFADITDRSLHAAMARFAAGVSPAALAQAYSDWAVHIAFAPGKRIQLLHKAVRKAARFGATCSGAACRMSTPSNASNRCRGIIGSSTKPGGDGPSISSTRDFCCNSNGGTTPRPVFGASRNSTRRWWRSHRASFLTWLRHRIFR